MNKIIVIVGEPNLYLEDKMVGDSPVSYCYWNREYKHSDFLVKYMKEIGIKSLCAAHFLSGVIDAVFNSPSGNIVKVWCPELGLSPAEQLKLGDIAIEAAARGTVIWTTWSEHMVLRLQRRIREGLAWDMVEIYEGSTGHRKRLDEQGDFVDEWDGGFFTERLGECFPEG